ncbi:hypothetical protein [Streptomyces sp. NPDC096153]|uniref:hypothetical protein n=1 Tax=Streptomyces sp. NPDC096153 TaxID=3155548 RepID=UPI003334692B
MPEGPDRHSLLLADFPTPPGPWTDPEPDTWHVATFAYEEAEPVREAEAALDSLLVPDSDEESDDDTQALDPEPEPADLSEIGDVYTRWRERQARRRAERLVGLARRWADGPVEDDNEWAERLLTTPRDRRDHATDATGKPVTAIPTDQTYQWSGQASDCSLDASVCVTLLNDPLLREAGLRRDPDQPHWYDADGLLRVQYLTWVRPSGKANALLVCQQWLEQQLKRLGCDLIHALRGERQTLSEHPRFWREFSQISGHSAQGHRTAGTPVTALKKSFR